MKIPTKLMGFLNYNENTCPFSVEKDCLYLYPKDENMWSDNLKSRYHSLRNSHKESRWIGHLDLYGKLSSGQNIMFRVSEINSSYNGFINFDIIMYIIYEDKLDLNKIQGFKITSDEINYFYSPNKTFESTIKFNEEKDEIELMSVKGNHVENYIGECMKDEVEIKVSVQAFPTIHFRSKIPFSAESEFIINLNKGQTFDWIYNLRHKIKLLMNYLCYRNNIVFDNTDLFIIDNNGKRNICGKMVITDELKINKENNRKKENKIIKFENIQEYFINLLEVILSGNMYFEHICNSIDETRIYTVSREILIFAAFEREFRNIYGQDYGRSEEYINIKEQSIELFNKPIEESHGKQKRYFKSIKEFVSKLDISLEQKILAVLDDCSDIIEPFVKFEYKDSLDNVKYDISLRMNKLRNTVAHAKINFDNEPIYLSDLKIIQILLYAMRLKNLGLEKIKIQQSIKDLFEFNILIL